MPGAMPGMGMPTLGGPKSLDDIDPLDDASFKEMVEGCEGFLKQGAPLEVPAAIALQDLCRIARSLRDLKAEADKVGELEAKVKRYQLELAKAGSPDPYLPSVNIPSFITPPK